MFMCVRVRARLGCLEPNNTLCQRQQGRPHSGLVIPAVSWLSFLQAQPAIVSATTRTFNQPFDFGTAGLVCACVCEYVWGESVSGHQMIVEESVREGEGGRGKFKEREKLLK